MHNPERQTNNELLRPWPEGMPAYRAGIEALELQHELGVANILPAYIVRRAGFGDNALMQVDLESNGVMVNLWRVPSPLEDAEYGVLAGELLEEHYLPGPTTALRTFCLSPNQSDDIEVAAYDVDLMVLDGAAQRLRRTEKLDVRDDLVRELTTRTADSLSLAHRLGLLDVNDIDRSRLTVLLDTYRELLRELMNVPKAEALHGLRASQQQLQLLRAAVRDIGSPQSFVSSYIPPELIERPSKLGNFRSELTATDAWDGELAHVVWRLKLENLSRAGMDEYLDEMGVVSDVIVSATPVIKNIKSELNKGTNMFFCYDTAEGAEGGPKGNMVLLQHTGHAKLVVGRHFVADDVRFGDSARLKDFSSRVMAMIDRPRHHVTEATARGLHELIAASHKPRPRMTPGMVARWLLSGGGRLGKS